MSRSFLVSLPSWALVAILLAPDAAVAQGFTEADLVGDYAFELQSNSIGHRGSHRMLSFLRMIGRFSVDGSGNLEGSRLFLRDENPRGNTGVTEFLEQEFTGTYLVESDGTGVMIIAATPNPPWDTDSGISLIIEDSESIHFVLANGGQTLDLTSDVPADFIQDADGRLVLSEAIQLAGHAAAQEPNANLADELADISARVEELTDLVARQSAQLCELLRLVNTPQGQRETSTPEVVDACGTGFQWRGEGTDGPRQGR